MPELVWKAHPKQARFLRTQEYAVLYGGAAGGGKTDALLIDLIRCCAQHPSAQTLFLMKTFKDLSEPGAALDRSHQLLTGIADWRGGDMRWLFPNGAKLQFGHLHHENDMYNYEQAQLDRLAVDSLTSLSKRVFLYLNSRVRATVPNLVPKVRAGTNPGNIGHNWVKEMFIEAAPWGEPFDLVDPDTHNVIGDARFIPARLPDNPTLMERDPTYEQHLNLLPDDLRRAYRDGDWDIFAGQFFTEWRRDRHVCEPFAVPAGWPRWRAVDWGYGKPYCCLWLARAPDRRLYVYRETYAPGILDVDQARAIGRASQGEIVRTTYADPSMWNTQANGSSVASVYAAKGISLLKANNDRNAGWQRVHEALSGDPPQLQVFSTCLNLIRTLPALIHDSIDVEDVDTDGEDHAADALRYGLIGGLPAQPTKTPYSLARAKPIDNRHWAEKSNGVMAR